MDNSKQIRTRLSYTILISVGATYIITALVGGLLINSDVKLTLPMVQGIRIGIFIVVGFAVWNILKRNEQQPDGKQ